MWTPLPPQRSGIADYSYRLMAELREFVDLVAVVRDGVHEQLSAPEGIEVIEASAFAPDSVDRNLYMMGNEPRFHGYMLGNIHRTPGVTVLHDLALVDFYVAICGGADTPLFRSELRYNCPELRPGEPIPGVQIDGHREPDRLRMLLTRRIVESSELTIVHSSWARDQIRARSPGARAEWLPLAADVSDTPVPHLAGEGDSVVFGTFGGINHYKRLTAVVEAFAEIAAVTPRCRLVIAGRADDRALEQSLRAFVDDRGLGGVVDFHTDVALSELERLIAASDVVLSLRWPTAGEMSATLMRALGAGRPVIVTDLPQFVDLDPAFAWRVPVDGEQMRLQELMGAAVTDHAHVRAAGIAARRYVEERATFAHVARGYHRLLQEQE